jgi:hypothetical protein
MHWWEAYILVLEISISHHDRHSVLELYPSFALQANADPAKTPIYCFGFLLALVLRKLIERRNPCRDFSHTCDIGSVAWIVR